MVELIPAEPRRRGHVQTHTAEAYVRRKNARECFVSHVSLGKGRVWKRNTETTDRVKALDYNRLHLLELLANPPGRKGRKGRNGKASEDQQLHMVLPEKKAAAQAEEEVVTPSENEAGPAA